MQIQLCYIYIHEMCYIDPYLCIKCFAYSYTEMLSSVSYQVWCIVWTKDIFQQWIAQFIEVVNVTSYSTHKMAAEIDVDKITTLTHNWITAW